jgi:hypothetical protein
VRTRSLGTVHACGASRAGDDRDARRAVERDQAPRVLAAHAPGADDLAEAVRPEAHDGSRVDTGYSRGLLRNELVDHFGRAQLGDGDGQLAQRGLLVEQITNPCLGRRATGFGAEQASAHRLRLLRFRPDGTHLLVGLAKGVRRPRIPCTRGARRSRATSE